MEIESVSVYMEMVCRRNAPFNDESSCTAEASCHHFEFHLAMYVKRLVKKLVKETVKALDSRVLENWMVLK